VERGVVTDKKPNLAKRIHTRLHANPVTGAATKIVVTIVGAAIVLVGVVLSGPGIPGPGLVVIVAGLALLATEWAWAEKLLLRARAWLKKTNARVREMDPAVRRRRIVLGLVGAVVLSAAAVWYLWTYDWPSFAVTSWDRVQGVAGFVPELPGM
jgi:uncharacterized protein (TIGR02611 family)